MFGYIKPFEPQLKVCELDTYKAVYCGVCRGLSKRFGAAARCTLSYDFTFLAMLYASLHQASPSFSPQRCPLNPFKRKPHYDYCDAVEFSCEMAILMLREKCADNVKDANFVPYLGWRLLTPVIEGISSSVGEKYPDLSQSAREMTQKQQETEALGAQARIDLCCDPTSHALSEIFMLMSNDAAEKRILSRLGYMLGRYMYLCDAVDDLDDDIKNMRFNPLRFNPDMDEHAAMLRFTVAQAASAYALLNPQHFKEILDNIIFMGLPAISHNLIERRRKRHE